MEDFADDPNAYEEPRPEAPPDIKPYLERLIGWGSEHAAAVARASDAVELARKRMSHLALFGPGDLVPIAQSIHLRTIGGDRPFIVVDPRRKIDPASGRSAARSVAMLAEALDAAQGGTVCIRAIRRPRDWDTSSARLADPDEDVRLTVCYPQSRLGDIELSRPTPVVVAELAGRDMHRLIDEYSEEARAALGMPSPTTATQREWMIANCHDHNALEAAVRRFLALSCTRGLCEAAYHLGMAPVSLSRWMRRRGLTVPMVTGAAPLPAAGGRIP